ncbi:hypothetical protein D3C80_1014560 [compost metagenome]
MRTTIQIIHDRILLRRVKIIWIDNTAGQWIFAISRSQLDKFYFWIINFSAEWIVSFDQDSSLARFDLFDLDHVWCLQVTILVIDIFAITTQRSLVYTRFIC